MHAMQEALKARRMTSFEVAEDVAPILADAEKNGIRLVWLINEALRKFRSGAKPKRRKAAR